MCEGSFLSFFFFFFAFTSCVLKVSVARVFFPAHLSLTKIRDYLQSTQPRGELFNVNLKIILTLWLLLFVGNSFCYFVKQMRFWGIDVFEH